MSIENYGELKTAVASNWSKRSDLDDRVPEFIALAEARIRMDTRLRFLATETTGDITISTQEVAQPSRFAGVRRLYLSADPNRALSFLSPADFWRKYLSTTTGLPVAYTIEGTNFVFGPSPDTTYTGKLLYWEWLTAFSADDDTNWLLTNAPNVYLYAALIEVAPFLMDDVRALTWATLYDDAVDNVKKADEMAKYPAGKLVSRSEVLGP